MPYHRILKGRAAKLPPAQRKLLDYILVNDEEAVFLTIQELSRRVDVSVATVVRLANTLGFSGFPEFQKELRTVFREKLTTISRLQKSASEQTSQEAILVNVFRQDIDNITETMKQVSADDFGKFVEALDRAGRIVIIGLRSAHALAVFMGVALGFLQRRVWIVEPGIGDMWDRLLGLRNDDVVVGISFPRYSRETVEVLRFAQDQGIRTLAITDSPVAPLARHADCVLRARCKIDSFIESFTAPLSLINAVVTALGVAGKENSLNSLQKLEGFWKSRRIYFEEES